ncbi:MAG: T9SS type A sorting domain-containing protein [Flavipsychrobacter sp.]|nr:T9SS type A sorting domain-containing protein [Flavipsychrobacter sp.]
MKTIICSLLLSFSFLAAYSQKIHFTDSRNTWQGYAFDADGHTWQPFYHYTGDSTFNGTTYKVLVNTYGGNTNFVREDTLQGLVYILINNTDRILYNYNLKAGDSISYVWAQNRVDSVVSTDSILINGVYHKTLYMKGNFVSGNNGGNATLTYTVVEGIGSPNGPLASETVYYFEGQENLTCFEQSNVKVDIRLLSHNNYGKVDSFVNCSHVAVNNISHRASTVKVVPNPGGKASKLLFGYIISNGTITVINEMGQVVRSTPFSNSSELEIGDALRASGVYFYRVTDKDSGVTFTGKFVFEE